MGLRITGGYLSIMACLLLLGHILHPISPVVHATNYGCIPNTEGCAYVEVLEFRDKAVGGVFVDGQLSHCKDGFCLMGQEYTEAGYLDTPEKLMVAVGCPDLQDAIEALQILEEWKRLEERSKLVVGERACTTMSMSSHYIPIYIMPTMVISAPRVEVVSRQYTPGDPGRAYSPVNTAITFVRAVIGVVATAVAEVMYPGSTDPHDPNQPIMGVVPSVTIPEGTWPANTMVTWIQKANGTGIKGTFKFDGDPAIGQMEGFAQMMGNALKQTFTVVRTTIDDYARATK